MKRISAGTLWAVVAMWAGTYVTLLLVLPTVVALPFALAIGAFVIVDPAGRIWPRATKQAAVPARKLAESGARPIRLILDR